MQALGRHDMGFDKAQQRIERRADRAHRVGHGRQRDRHAFQRVALGLAVQRLMLAELLEHDHRQQARPRPAPRDDMERRRRLADLLAIPAGELLPHRLDHLPLARLRLQRPGHVLAELAQTVAAAAFAGRRRIDHHALARQMVGERVALGALAREAGDTWSSWRPPPPPRVRLPSRWLPVLRTSATIDRSAAPSVPSAARRPGAPAWRSAASAGRSAPCLPTPWRARPPVPRRLAGPWLQRVASAAFRAATSWARASPAASMRRSES